MNRPLCAHDVLGLWTEIVRKKENEYWTVIAHRNDEPIATLVWRLRSYDMYLSPDDAIGGWLKREDGSDVRRIEACKKYRGPNTIHMTYGAMVGPGFWGDSFANEVHEDMGQMKAVFAAKDYYVRDHWDSIAGTYGHTLDQINFYVREHNTAGWFHGGHGDGGDYYGPATGKFITHDTGTSAQSLHPSSAFTPRWKLSVLAFWVCHARLQDWSGLRGSDRYFYAESGAIDVYRKNPFIYTLGEAVLWTY